MSNDLTIRFPNKGAALAFKSWLCNVGEQQYWDYMDCQDPPNNSVRFDYHTEGSVIHTELQT